jgi:hypothetical protein
VIQRAFDALLVDLDGTLVTDEDEILPGTIESLRAAQARGVRVMVSTGRSELATIPVLALLGLDSRAVVYNGCGLWCPGEQRLIEERVLSERTLERAVGFGERNGFMTVAMCAGRKHAIHPRDEVERLALRDMVGLSYVESEVLKQGRAIRVSFFSDRHPDSAELAREAEEYVAQPVFMTHFPLNLLAHHKDSPLTVVDVHPPCRGKAEAVRVLEEQYGIAPERVVAVGDATNDIGMFEAVGLSVCMETGMPEAIEAADRVIGGNNTGAIESLVRELFLG